MMHRIARVVGEAVDADHLEWRCEDCGRDEYGCHCGPCDHHAIMRRGQLTCRHCRAVYVIGLDGGSWVEAGSGTPETDFNEMPEYEFSKRYRHPSHSSQGK